ncbi:putative VRR-DNA nuclease [Idiomarinaceae phage Phi1M2-2]|uniref:putative VRR-DNA nuclease n=1 Tax=Idiomarinaceae phage Phi1M2-2 TaxID=1527515 RepID=UPI0004F85498|nr:putative VRR-DNA nuclease [Idiomarinaceae phage Phi1M2-2]AIM40814.1 putative VRR-DNA nuclease [Idiomarinaceae phage Phi1M2-2]
MKIPSWLPAYGDQKFRGPCPPEGAEQITFFNQLRAKYPDSYGVIAIHPRNEGKRTHQQTARQKAEGMTKGASDIIIPGSPAFCCELKRQDHTKSQWQEGQIDYLEYARKQGAFVCVAFGWEAAWEALQEWISITKN